VALSAHICVDFSKAAMYSRAATLVWLLTIPGGPLWDVPLACAIVEAADAAVVDTLTGVGGASGCALAAATDGGAN
jgi:hypothetical protein